MKIKPSDSQYSRQKQIAAADELRDKGQLDAAVLAYQAIISVAPNFALAHYKLGTAYQRSNRFHEAAESFKLAIKLRPGYPEANNNLGIILSKQGNDADAEVCYRNAVAENTDYFEAHLNLGNMFRLGSRRAEALYWYRRAIVLNPTSAKAKERLGALYVDLGLHTEAMVQLREALVLDPQLAAAWINLGRCHNAFQQLDDAQNCARTAIPLDPNQMAPWHNLLFASNWRAGEKTEVFELHKLFGDHLLNTIKIEPRSHFKNRPDRNRRLRIGLVSGDLRRHSVSYFVQGILENVNQNQIEFWAYYNHPQFDYRSSELKSLFTEWRSIDGMNNAEAAELIYGDSIDILIDLAGHTGHSSLYVFAAKPAPVQASWIGYPNTSGLSTIDYRISDEIADPTGDSERYYTETLLRLPNTFLCYSPPKEAPDVAQSPCLTAGYVTFGSFNTRVKISDDTLALWSQILQRVPNSRLVVKSVSGVSDDHGQNRMLEQMRQCGIDTDRVVLLPPYPAIEDHLAAYHKLDIALDTLPYCGTTTTCEALWMGVPVVTLRGDRHASRVGASLLTSIGLAELIGETPEEYVRIAAGLAHDHDRLTRLRTSMRAKMSASPLLDATTSTRNVERALRQMWVTYCDSVQASVMPGDEARADCLDVKTGAGYFLAINADPLSDMTSWVLLEQEDWFEDDLQFVQALCLPSWHALDIGASHGVYSLALAAAGAAKVWAFEPAIEPRLKFRDSLARNDYYEQIEILQFGLAETAKTVQTTQRGREELAHFMALDSIANDLIPSGVRIDFVKLDAEGGEVAILRGGLRFFLEQSPLVMFECRHGSGTFDAELVSIFRAMGYGIYRLVPGISALVEVILTQETSLDGFTLNLYACKPEQAILLSSRDFLIASSNTCEIVPLQNSWSVELFSIPAIAATLPSTWTSYDFSSPYGCALLAWCGSKNSELNAAVRYVLLGEALKHVQAAVESDDNHPAVAALGIRLCADYGLRGQALGIASAFLEQMQAADDFPLDRPLPPSYEKFDTRAPLVSLAKLLFQSVVEFVLDKRQHSLFFTAQVMPNFDDGFRNPEHSARFERTAVLCSARVGKPLSLNAGAKIFSDTQDNQNSDIWQRLALDGKLLAVSGRADWATELLSHPFDSDHAKSSDDEHAHHRAAMAALALGETNLAERHWREAIALSPSFADAHHNLGLLLLQLGRALEAQVEFRRVVELHPQDAGALMNLAVAQKDCGDFAAAEAAFRRAMVLAPNSGNAVSEAYFCAQQQCNWTNRRNDELRLIDLIRLSVSDVSPFILLSVADDGLGIQAATQRQVARCYAIDDLSLMDIRQINLPLRSARTRLRIGYLSSDFYAHATMYLLRGVLHNHDKSRFEIFAYSYTATEDAMTTQVRGACDTYRDIQMMSDEAAARLIADDGIDILVDLKGYTGGARLGICARRPAPLIVSWLGYPGSLGHEALADVIIGDAIVTPVDASANYSEQIVRMPHCYQPNDNARLVGVKPSREEAGLPETGIVFCCFNSNYKITPEVFQVWCRLLRDTPYSVLWLLAATPQTAKNLCHEAKLLGVSPDRLIFAQSLPHSAHLGRLQLADIALDTYPYTSHTTGSDALWAGVPLVTKIGETFASRVAASLLNALGTSELVTMTWQDYYEVARRLATSKRALKAKKSKIARLKATAPLFDTPRFTRDLEALYAGIWQQRNDKSSEPSEPATATTEMRLHVGGIQAKAGWKILNALPGPNVDFVGDVRNLAAFADGSCSEIYCSHILEHISQNEMLPTLKELHRLLKTGGRLMISVPDLEVLCELFIDPKLSGPQRFHVMRMMFGGQIDAYDFHQIGLSAEFLADYLRLAGFSSAEQVEGFDLFDDTSNFAPYGRAISLNVVATK